MISHVISAWSATWSVHDCNVISAWSGMWSVYEQPREQCMISHVISAWSDTWSVYEQPRDHCMHMQSGHQYMRATFSVNESQQISAWSATWSVHHQARDQCMISFMIRSQLRDRTRVSYVSCMDEWVLYHLCHLRPPSSIQHQNGRSIDKCNNLIEYPGNYSGWKIQPLNVYTMWFHL